MHDIKDSEFFLEAQELAPKKSGNRLLDGISNVKNAVIGLFKGMSSLGESISMITVLAAKSLAKMSLNALKKLGAFLKPNLRKAGVLFKLLLLKAMMPFVNIYSGCRTLSQRYRIVKESCGNKFALRDCALTSVGMLWGSKKHLASFFNIAAPIASIVFFFGLFNYISGLEYAVSVEYNGQELGFIETEGDIEQAQVEVLKRISYVDGNETVSFTPKFSLKIIDAQSHYMGTNELADKMIVNSSEELAQAYGLYIGEDFYGAVSVEDYETVLSQLNTILDSYSSVSGAYNVQFVNEPVLTSGLYLTESIISTQDSQELFDSKVTVQTSYTIQNGDTPESIAVKNNMTVEELSFLNPDVENICYAGAKVTVTKEQSFLPVTYCIEKKSTSNIAHTSISVDDASLTKGTEEIAVVGEDGILETTEEVVYIDGEISTRKTVSTSVIKEPVTEEVRIGTKEPVQYAYYPTSEYTGAIENLGTGTFIRPCTTGYVSCYFSSWHHGVDIATDYGTPIYAADDGTVIVSGWHYSYGNYVMIDHGNGYVTLYAHASALNVEAGAQVTQGTKIAEIGSTGNSNGNHVHFEVRQNGAYTNPLNYIAE
ncbi:MAG: peptidoglycan DD-metalloendopeptidase family protein [Oscillospiraceae bacterium]|nr:peptidoglycan DD-metalloendopeptidase family protein [Oscillospiraceae bacterium]